MVRDKSLVKYFYDKMKHGKNVWKSFEKDLSEIFGKNSFFKKYRFGLTQEAYFTCCASLQQAFEELFEDKLREVIKFGDNHELDQICLARDQS